MKIGFHAYVSKMFFITILSALVCFTSFSIINILAPQFLWLIFPPNLTYLLTLVALPLLVGGGAFIAQYILPIMKAGSRKGRIESYLPITSSHMAVLASAGVDPEKIVRIAAQSDPKMILSDEIGSILVKMDLLGYNIITALEEGVKQSPSTLYGNLLKGFAYTIRTGGNLRRFFLQSTSQLLDRRSKIIQQFLSTLAMLAETYVLMFAAFPLLLIIMLSVMASVGGTLGGFDLITLMYLFTFAIMPVMAIFYILIIDLIQPKG